jgi:putative transposase
MSHFIDRITPIHICWQLHGSGISPEDIPAKIGVHRATVYRWLAGIKKKGFGKFLADYQQAKKGRRKRKINPVMRGLVFQIRKEYKQCCGQKIQHILRRDYGQKLGVSSIYRILGERYQLRSKWKKYVKRGDVFSAQKPREVIQVDTVDFEELFAFTSLDIFTKEPVVVMKTALTSKAGKEALQEQLRRFGKVEKIQRDGGSEFEKEWEEEMNKRNIPYRTARPYKKNEQSFIERFNGILRKECLGYQKFKRKDLREVQRRVDEYVKYYLNKRPHMGLNMQTPKEFTMSHLT